MRPRCSGEGAANPPGLRCSNEKPEATMRIPLRHTIVAAAVLACASAVPLLAADNAPQTRTQAAQTEPVFAVVNGTTISAREFESSLTSAARNKFYHRTPPEAELVA